MTDEKKGPSITLWGFKSIDNLNDEVEKWIEMYNSDTSYNDAWKQLNSSFDNESIEEKAKRIGVPIIPAREVPPSYDPNPTVAICGACGLEIKQIMGYVCNKSNCPTGLGSPTC